MSFAALVAGVDRAVLANLGGEAVTYQPSSAEIIKLWSFLAGVDGLPLSSADVNHSAAWLGSDGSPAGCMAFTATPPGAINGTVKCQSLAMTWEDLGVPVGAVVTHARLQSFARRLFAHAGGINSHSWALELVSSVDAGVPIVNGVAGRYLISDALTLVDQAAWENGAGLEYPVFPAYQASNTPFLVKLWWFTAFTGAGSIEWRVDELRLQARHAAVIQGLFDKDFTLFTSEGDVVGPTVFLRLEDVPVHPKDDDPVLTIGGTDYNVRAWQEDGLGGLRLMLSWP